MGVVKYSVLVDQIIGKVGGSVFQQMAQSKGVRIHSYAKPSHLLTSQQSRVQFNGIAGLWHTLTSANKADWSAKASGYPHKDRYGNPTLLSGYQLFIKNNRYLQLLNLSMVTVASVYNAGSSLGFSIDSIDAASGVASVSYVNARPANHAIICFISKNKIFLNTSKKYKVVYCFNWQSSSSSPFNIQSNFLSVQKTYPAAGEMFYFKFFDLNTLTGQCYQNSANYGFFI